MIRSALFLFIILSVGRLCGQAAYIEAYKSQDSLIDKAVKEENYKLAATLIDQQFLLIKSHDLSDSLYHYCYDYGRAIWKTIGVEKGISEAKRISDEVKENDPDIKHYLQTINDLSWLYYETGNVNLCLKNDSLYLAICLKEDGIPTELTAIAYYNLGFDYVESGMYNKALENFQYSVNVILNSEDSITKQLSMSYNALGAMQWRIGELEKAGKSYEKSLLLVQQFNDPKSMLEQGNILGNMGLIYQDNGEIIKAKEFQERFLNIDRKALGLINDASLKETALRRMSSAYINLADIYYNLGDYEKARNLVELAINERKKITEPNDPSLAGAIEHLAYIELHSGNPEMAEEKLTDYLNYCLDYFGEKSAFTAWAYKEMGNLYRQKKQYLKSLGYFNKAINSQQAVSEEKSDQDLGRIYKERSVLFANMDDHEQAIKDLYQSMKIYRNSLDENNSVVIGIYLEIAKNKLIINDIHGAEKDLDRVFHLLPENKIFETKPTSHLLPQAHYLKALIGIKKDSTMASLESALIDLEKGIEYLKIRKQTFLDEESKLLLYNTHEKIFQLAEQVTFSLYKNTGNEIWLEKLFGLTEENKTILLRSRLQNFSSLDYAGVPDSILTAERKLTSKLRNENNDPEATKNIVDTERRFDSLKDYLRNHYPDYYSLKYRDKGFTISDVQEKLLNDSISMMVYSVTATNIYAILINKNNIQAFKLPKGDLAGEIRSLNDAVIHDDKKEFSKNASQLYKRLVAPLKNSLNRREIVIVPDKELFFLNFELLQKESNHDFFDNSTMLIHDYVISYYLSANVTMQFRKLNNDKPANLIAFAPGFSDQDKQTYKASVSDTSRIDKKFLSYLRQPFAVNAAMRIAGLYNGSLFTGKEASETNFKREARKYGIIHLGTHAEMNQLSPLMSHLVMSKNMYNDSVDDGYLHAYEIYQMPLRAELAVLTACETGMGKQLSSEGVVSLAHSFTYAGCPSIVMTLWNVDEKTSSKIINSFYSYLSEGLPKNIALRKAKLDFLQNCPEELKSPYFWAGIVLLGDQSPVEINSASSNLYIYLIGLGLMIVVFYFVMIRKR